MGNHSIQPDVAKPKRRWLRFSLRTLLLLTAVIAAWFGWQVNKAQKQKAAVAAVEAAGGTVEYQRLNRWRRLFQPVHVWHVTEVDFESGKVDDNLLESVKDHLENLASLKALSLRNTRITDKGLLHLRGLRSLYWLYIIDAPITDAGLLYIGQIPNLAGVSHAKTKATWEGRQEFRRRNPDIYLTE